MGINTDSNGNNDHNSRCECRNEEVSSKLNKTEKFTRRIEILEMVQTVKRKKITRKIFKYI